MSRSEAHIAALQATVASLTAQIAALPGGGGGALSASKLLSNVQSGTGNTLGPTVVPAWSGSFTTNSTTQCFTAHFTALTGENNAALCTYDLLIDGAVVGSKTVLHTYGTSHYTVTITAVTQLAAGAHTFGLAIPDVAAVNDGDYADLVVLEG